MKTKGKDFLKRRNFLTMVLISSFFYCQKLFTYKNIWMIEKNLVKRYYLKLMHIMSTQKEFVKISN